MATQFVGFLGGWNHPGQLPPLAGGHDWRPGDNLDDIHSCFLWIFLGDLEKLRRQDAALTTTLSAVTAAVVGVVLNLAGLVRPARDLSR